MYYKNTWVHHNGVHTYLYYIAVNTLNYLMVPKTMQRTAGETKIMHDDDDDDEDCDKNAF